jgi:macrodomain Ter protein organizer (MatP/YcbG family)
MKQRQRARNEKDIKTKQVSIRLDLDVYKKLEKISENEDYGMSGTIRKLIMEEYNKR